MRVTSLLVLPLLVLTACGTQPSGSSQVDVVAAAYPFSWLVQRIGGPDVQVTDLVKPGAEPHDVELSPRQVGALQQADLVVYLRGFQPAVDDALGDGDQGLDVGAVVQQQPLTPGTAAKDPHVWLDPVRMRVAAMELTERLLESDPAHAAGYRTRRDAVLQDLSDLEATFKTALIGCARTEFVTAHSAFGYLASRFGLTQQGISGLSPDAEPSPRRVAEVATFARERGVTTIFFESLVDPKIARTVAAEIGAKTAVLDPLEGVRGGDDYLSVQRRNAQALHDALGCA